MAARSPVAVRFAGSYSVGQGCIRRARLDPRNSVAAAEERHNSLAVGVGCHHSSLPGRKTTGHCMTADRRWTVVDSAAHTHSVAGSPTAVHSLPSMNGGQVREQSSSNTCQPG